MDKLRKTVGVEEIVTHMCAFGMKAKDAYGEGHVYKATRFLTTSTAIRDMLNKKCSRDHRHVHLVDGRAKAAAIYPQELVEAILEGLQIEQKKVIHHAKEIVDDDGGHVA